MKTGGYLIFFSGEKNVTGWYSILFYDDDGDPSRCTNVDKVGEQKYIRGLPGMNMNV